MIAGDNCVTKLYAIRKSTPIEFSLPKANYREIPDIKTIHIFVMVAICLDVASGTTNVYIFFPSDVAAALNEISQAKIRKNLLYSLLFYLCTRTI